MSQLIDVPGQGQVEFPDGMSDEQIVAAIKANSQPAPSLGTELGRQVGLTARAGMKGLGAIPNMVLDPLVGLYNRATGSQAPSFSQRQDQALTNLGLPVPKNATERIAQAGAESLVPVGGLAKIASKVPALAPFAERLGTQALSSLLGSTASESAKEGGASPAVQFGAGLLGGVGLPTTLAAANAGARMALRVPGSILEPLSEQGRQSIVGRAYQRAATDPRTAAENIANAPEYVPGVRPNTAELAQDSGISALYKALINRSPAQFSDQSAANDAARQAFLAQSFGNEADLNMARIARDAKTRPLRESALSSANDTTRNILDIEAQTAQKQASKAQALQQYGQMATGAAEQQTFANNFTPVRGMPRVPGSISPNQELVPTYQSGAQDAAKIAAQRQAEREALDAQREAIPYTPLRSSPIINSIQGALNVPGIRSSDVASKTLSDVEAKLGAFTDRNGVIDAHDLYTIRKEIGNTIEKNAKDTNNWDKKMTAGLERDIQGTIDKAIIGSGGTDWPEYLQKYRDLSKEINAMKTGQELYKAGLTTKDKLSQSQFARAVSNRADEVAAMDARGSDVVSRVNRDLKRSTAPADAMRTAGSDSVQNLAGAAMLNSVLGKVPMGPVGRAVGKLGTVIYSPFETKTQEMLLNAMLDPSLGRSALLRKIPQKQDLVAQFLASRFPISYGGLLGTMSNQ